MQDKWRHSLTTRSLDRVRGVLTCAALSSCVFCATATVTCASVCASLHAAKIATHASYMLHRHATAWPVGITTVAHPRTCAFFSAQAETCNYCDELRAVLMRGHRTCDSSADGEGRGATTCAWCSL
eukprot:6199770-Pleurochrysis_carterae.AAC.11